ncbi:universal stress protein [Microbispora sp. NBRC 16548]|uniref:universal stress protein n=1 Tax=Microbispora sp. NBRC 16548 TaxID=3030994 RepID=UPI0024A4744C|nr:universal stress protein [Microbispora sp. NBRC 16548]GLX11395.1 universal stress protein [Microbispora sp. NBRC 16548]
MSGHEQTRSVLVGYDGSPASEQALRFGVEEARLRGLPLTVCHAWHWPYPLRPPEENTLEILKGIGAIVADEGVRKAHALAEGLDVRWRLERGWAPAVLLEASRDAALTVLGARGHGGFDDVTVGSTAAQVPARANRPVVIVRPDLPPTPHPRARIVVGVDGSPASEAALGFAFEEAELRGALVEAVCDWWDPAALPGPDRVPFIDPESLRVEAITRFERTVAPWKTRHPRVSVETKFVIETPRRALVKAAEDATLLVVGNRGIGSAPKMLLGPVTQTALHEAPCPVAVVPGPQGGSPDT